MSLQQVITAVLFLCSFIWHAIVFFVQCIETIVYTSLAGLNIMRVVQRSLSWCKFSNVEHQASLPWHAKPSGLFTANTIFVRKIQSKSHAQGNYSCCQVQLQYAASWLIKVWVLEKNNNMPGSLSCCMDMTSRQEHVQGPLHRMLGTCWS